MPSFDVVSEVDKHELTNAIDQTNREVTNRFDFKGTNARVERNDNVLTIIAVAEFQIKQIVDILQVKMTKRGIDIDCLDFQEVTESNNETRQNVNVREGIEKDIARKMIKLIKDSKIKVQAQIQQNQLRVSGKKRDDLQNIIAELKAAKLGLPLQYVNFRD
ncbi:MAG: YajQ family cyclic di-GMP-binding protein [Proteobacteria bacterium]|nr:YajQ family cyclic di-GMP-binding protein [Pseudomonadota bacterium]MCZ6892929.1 YajQ family cyclic di-GMP-binding protein [Gammaproteobacteria bacterium]